jgi:hypothetical protein
MKTTVTTSTLCPISHHRSIPAIIVVLVALAVIISNTIMIVTPSPAFAIKLFYNCMTDTANKYGKLTIDDVTICYDKEYHTGPYYVGSSISNHYHHRSG